MSLSPEPKGGILTDDELLLEIVRAWRRTPYAVRMTAVWMIWRREARSRERSFRESLPTMRGRPKSVSFWDIDPTDN